MKTTQILMGILAVAGIFSIGWAIECDGNMDCGAGLYCAKAAGDCEGKGECTKRPTACIDVLDPVCGCDGIIYSNSCYAAMAGVNVACKGMCRGACVSNLFCGAGNYCFFEICGDGPGVCRQRPTACPDIWDPVCGCNGVTYSNACYAAMAGVSVDYEGPCKSTVCTSNDDCDQGDYCRFETCQDSEGVCEVRPTVCPDVWDPVCGCDGNTYGNACEAAAAGMSVRFKGPCIPGPVIEMLEPKAMVDDVHTGPGGVDRLRILWSEPISFSADDVNIVDENGGDVEFSVEGDGTAIMSILWKARLLHNRYAITIADTVIGSSGAAIDGDKDGVAGGDAIIIMEHRRRADLDNNNRINLADLARFAEEWLWQE